MISDDDRWENHSNAALATARIKNRLDRADDYLLKAVRVESWRRKLQFIGLAMEMIDTVANNWPPPKADERVK